MAEGAFVKVTEVGDLPPGEMKMVEVGENQILLANVAGNIWACDNICTHAGAPLSTLQDYPSTRTLVSMPGD
mgnify:CR=1 FL=1